MRSALLIGLTFLTALSGTATTSLAQQEETKARSAQVDPRLAAELASPRATMRTFLSAVNDNRLHDAARCLNLSELGAAKVAGPNLAYLLKSTLDRMERIDLKSLPDDGSSEMPFALSEVMTDLKGADLADAQKIVIARTPDGLWKFTPATVDEIEDLWDRWQDRPIVKGLVENNMKQPFEVWLRMQFPENLRQQRFLLPDYQWICLFVLIFLGFLVDLVVRVSLRHMTSAWFKLYRGSSEMAAESKLWKPIGLLAQATVWYLGTTLIGLPALALKILLAGLKLFAVVSAVWTAFLFINLLAAYLAKKAEGTDTKFDDLLVPMISKSLKIFVVCVGVLSCAEAFGLPIAGLIGGLGIGGLALAMASKDAVANLFGSLTVLIDRPFEVGDWVITSNAEGSVETVGFRSTRIRTFYNSLISVPNSLLTTAVVDNMGRRRFRRIKTMIGVQYDTTPDQIDAFCEGIRELIRRHPYTRKDYYHVYFNGFSDSSLDILLYCFVECPDWSVELREKHRLYLDIVRLAHTLGVSFAFPTRTLHMFQEESPTPGDPMENAERLGQRAAAQIAGPALAADARPGGVEFVGPTEFDEEE